MGPPLGAVPGLRDVCDRVAVPSPLLLCRPAPIWCATPSREGRGDRDPVKPRRQRAVSGPRGATGRPHRAVHRRRKVHSVGAARLPQIGGLSLGLLSLKPLIASPSWSLTTKSTTLNG